MVRTAITNIDLSQLVNIEKPPGIPLGRRTGDAESFISRPYQPGTSV
jgi:hypothetical protein